MNDKQRRARAALFSIKEIVLKVLYDARDEGPIEVHTIRERLGIPNVAYTSTPNAFILGILDHLKRDGSVRHILHVEWEIKEETAAIFDATQLENGV